MQAQFGQLAKRIKKATDTFTPWSPAQEEAIGQAGAAKMFNALGYYDNPAMTKYVNLVGNTTAQQGARPDIHYHFAILDSEIVNAFALPGGYIFVTRGTLANLQNEAELAGVLAHEVAHVDGHHLEKEVRNKKATSWAVEEGTAKIPAGSELNALTNDLITHALGMRYSQDKEDEADRKGIEFAAKAGYDPSGLTLFLQRMKTAYQDPSTHKALGLYGDKTHPPFDQRVAKLQPIVEKQKQGGQALPDRYAKNVDFTKPPQPAGAAVAVAGSSGCTLIKAKERVQTEMARLSGAAVAMTDNPCSVDEAQAKIAEARAVIQELDRMPAAKAAAAGGNPAAKPAAAKATTAKKK
jgi:predicted Zn-dependent protease